MADTQSEPTMEEILASIRRIIAEDPNGRPASPAPSVAEPASPVDDIPDELDEELERLYEDEDELDEEEEAEDLPSQSAAVAPVKPPLADDEILELTRPVRADEGILSHETAELTQATLTQLSQMIVRGGDPDANSLEGLVRELLRPMLKEWLDARLPEIVEAMVAREIARITGGIGR